VLDFRYLQEMFIRVASESAMQTLNKCVDNAIISYCHETKRDPRKALKVRRCR
jgi:hypothetical protein